MPEETPQDWQFEHALTTMFACRSVIKYNSPLNNDQRQDLIRDIDQALQFLRSGFISSAPVQTRIMSPAYSMPAQVSPPSSALGQKGGDNERETLRALYRLYYVYRDGCQPQGSEAFISRFTNAMSALSEIQAALEQRGIPGMAEAYPIDYVCAFIADLYYVFVEFMHSLAEILEVNETLVETEQLSLKQSYQADSEALDAHRLTLLYKIYEAQQCLTSRYGPVNKRVQEAQAFLSFLEETMCSGENKQGECMLQFSCVSRLLNDLAKLVEDYEQAVFMLLR
jgi:flagellar biosynthesis chaperone FliJ